MAVAETNGYFGAQVMADNELSVTKGGITVKGDVVDDLRPLIRRGTATPDSILRFLNNVVTLPLDFMSSNLERFRQRFEQRFEEIPINRRQEPSARVGYSVVQRVAISGGEPELQELFANLLASASDSEKASQARSGFADVIGQLEPVDARVLRTIAAISRRDGQFDFDRLTSIGGHSAPEASAAVSNLDRLRVVEWRPKEYSRHELERFAGMDVFDLRQFRNLNTLPTDLSGEIKRLKFDLLRQFQSQMASRTLTVTAFGRAFLSAVVDQDASSAPED
jgi:hypothetical protein